MKLAKIIKQCRIDKPEKFKLADFDPAETFGFRPSMDAAGKDGVIKPMMAGVNPQASSSTLGALKAWTAQPWMIVSAAIVEAIEALKPSFGQALKDLKKAERALRAEGD
jgi:hypothetical protein